MDGTGMCVVFVKNILCPVFNLEQDKLQDRLPVGVDGILHCHVGVLFEASFRKPNGPNLHIPSHYSYLTEIQLIVNQIFFWDGIYVNIYIVSIYPTYIKHSSKKHPRVAILINLLPKNPKHQRLEMLLQMHARKPAHFHGPDTSQVSSQKKKTSPGKNTTSSKDSMSPS